MATTPKDEEYGWPVVISPNHYRTHAGQSFVSGHAWSEVSTRLADNASGVILIKPGGEMHIRFGVAASGDADVQLFRGATTSASTTARTATIQNKSGHTVKQSQATVRWGTSALVSASTWTSTTWGSPYPAQFLPGGAGGNAGGGSIGDLVGELNLSTSYTYALRAINRSGLIGTVAMTLDWYEPHLSVGSTST